MAADAHPASITSDNNTNSPRSSRAAAHDAQDRATQSPSGSAAGSSNVSLPPENADANAAAAKGRKLAWNLPSTNGAVTEAGPAVMGAVSWPALSESTRPSSRTASSDSLKAVVSDGSVAIVPPSANAISSSSSISINSTGGATLMHAPNRENTMRRHGANDGNTATNDAGGSLSSAPLESGNSITPEPSPGNSKNGDRTPGGGGDNAYNRDYNRRGNKGGGNSSQAPHQGSYQNRKEPHDRGGYEWNRQRGFSNRELRMQPPPLPRAVHRPFMGPPPLPLAGTPFIVSPPVQPIGKAMGYPEIVPPMFYYPAPMMPEPPRGMPFVPPPVTPLVYASQPDNRAVLVKQIDYYFSPENLCKDIYLRQNMDDQGWVSVDLIANFNRVKQLTNNKEYILDVIQASEVVQVKDGKIRKRNDWMSWVLPSQSPSSQNYDSFAVKLQNTRLEDGMTNHSQTTSPSPSEALLTRSDSGNFISQSRSGEANGIWAGSATGHVDARKATP